MAAMDDCGLEMVSDDSKVWKSLLGPYCTTVSDFKKIIEKKSAGSKTKEELNTVGAIILRECIVDKLNLLIKKASEQSDKQSLRNRIQFYNSPDFIQRFTEKMPTKTDKTRTKYASYFDLLFNVVSKEGEGWRTRLNPYSDQEQCMRAKSVDKTKFKTVPQFQNNPNTNTVCYLCNRAILSSETSLQKTMECEHILPVSCALSHWWLIKSPTKQTLTPARMDVLSKEYGWSHRCCNQIKTNSEFIVYDGRKKKYVFNIKLVRTMLSDISTSTNYDCSVANSKGRIDINKQLINIQKIVQPLLDKINNNLTNTGSNDMYDLICKLKIISAMSMESFESVIANTENTYDGNAAAIKSQKTRDTKKQKKKDAKTQLLQEKMRGARERASQAHSRAARNRAYDQRRNTETRTGRKQNGGAAAEEQTVTVNDETVYNIDYEVAKLLNLINSGGLDGIKRDIEEKYEDLIDYYKYTVFHTNSYGKLVKHKYWIYTGEGEDPVSAMNTIRQNADDRAAAEVSPEEIDIQEENKETWVWNDHWNGWYQDYWIEDMGKWASVMDYDNWVTGKYDDKGHGIYKKKKQGRKKRNTRRKNQKHKKKRNTMRKKQRIKK